MNLNWKKVKQENDLSPKDSKTEHSLTYLKHENALLLFGQSIKRNQLYLFSLDQFTWRLQPTQGRKPTSRSYFASHYDEKQGALYIHGGEAEPKRSLDDFHVLFTKSWTWKKVFSEIPGGRHGHRMVQHLGSKIIHGGIREPQNHLLNDTWIIKGSLKYTQQAELHGFSFQQLKTKGVQPKPRKHHQLFVYKNEMFVIGGQTLQKKCSLSIYSLSLVTYSWKQIDLPKGLKQRSNFSLVNKSQSTILIFGGIQCEDNKLLNDTILFDLKTSKIQTITINKSPSSRCNHCMVTSSVTPFQSWMMGGDLNKIQSLQIYELSDLSQQQQINSLNYQQYIEYLQSQYQKQKQQQLKLSKSLSRVNTPSTPPQNSNQVQHLLTLIKNQQFLSQQLHKKDTVLEQLLKQVQHYMHILYQNYKDYGEQTHQIQSAKQNHIYICLKLKETYLNIQKLNKRNLIKIQSYRDTVVNINRQLQGFMQTQVDEQMYEN